MFPFLSNESNILANENGFTLLELVIVVSIMAIWIPILFSFSNMGIERLSQKVVGEHLKVVTNAVDEYVLANYATLQAAATDTVSTSFTIADLISDGHLPTNFNTSNAWGQSYAIYVLEPNTDHLQAVIITSGGRDQSISADGFEDQMVPTAAKFSGTNGGYVPSGDVPGETSTVLMGAMGGWEFTFAGTDVPNPGSGHLGAMIYYDSSDVDANDYLHRVLVPGSPELNNMTVDLGMDGNTINMGGGDVGGLDTEGVGRVNFESLTEGAYACAVGDDSEGSLYFDNTQGLFLCRNGNLELISDSGNSGWFQSAGIVTDGDIITQPTCPSSQPTPYIYFSVAMASEDDVFRPIQGLQPYAIDNGDGTWTARFRLQANGDWMYPSSTYGKVSAMVTCGT